MYGRVKQVHFVGIGGIGMSGIAEVMLNMGYEVTGSDLQRSSSVKRLEGLGATVHIGHDADNIHGADVVVRSSAIRGDNPEIQASYTVNIPVVQRAEMLAELMRLKYGIAVAGSHGKTTTTSMIATVLTHGGLDPTIVVGGRVVALGTNAKLGQGDFMVVEADESDGSFLLLSPVISVITNIDKEHMDHYRDLEELEQAFVEFANKIPFYGLAVLCADCPKTLEIAKKFPRRALTYGFSDDAELSAENVEIKGFETRFQVVMDNNLLGSVTLNVPGSHNVLNALASVAVGLELGLSFERVQEGLAEFSGIERRLEVKGRNDDYMVVDDYAHHPAEIAVTIDTLKNSLSRRLVVIFQPHRYSRTQNLFNEFATAFGGADVLCLLDIYAASEDPIPGVDSESLAEAIRDTGHGDVSHISDEAKLYGYIDEILKPGDVVLTLGAGNVWRIAEKIAERLG